MFSSGAVVAGVVIFAVVFLFVVLPLVYVRNYIKVPPNEVGVFTGLGKVPTVVRGGAKFRVPGLVRVDMMSLEPVPVDIKLRGSLSSERVPINVDAVGMIRYGASDEMLQTAVQRFLTSDPDSLKAQINEILSGSMRGIVAKMTPEEINSDREKLRENVIDDAGGSLAKIGMEVDVLTVAGISDDVGYLASLGEKRTAEVKRDASIAKAEAERDSKIKSAQAKQAGDVAQAQADTAIAQAEEGRDKELAAIKARVDAENAKADQAGPLADAQARKAVVTAEQEAEAAREQARVEVEQQRAERAKEALVADIVAPAEAEQQATVTLADGERQARILKAQADAEAARQDGAAQADARKLAADAFRAEQEAQADGLLAKLKAEAQGQQQLAEALNTYGDRAVHLRVLPDLLRALVEATEAAAQPVGEIDKITVIGGSGDTSDALGVFQGVAPATLARVSAVLADNGIDVTDLLKGFGTTKAEEKAVVTSVVAEGEQAG